MAIQENLSVSICFRFSEVIVQMFITVRGTVQGSFRASPPSLFMSSYDHDGELGEPPPPPHTHTTSDLQIRMERSTYAVDTSRVHFIRHRYVTCTLYIRLDTPYIRK